MQITNLSLTNLIQQINSIQDIYNQPQDNLMELGNEVWDFYALYAILNRDIYADFAGQYHPLITLLITLIQSNSIQTQNTLCLTANNNSANAVSALGSLSAILVYCVANNVDVNTLNINTTQTFLGYLNALQNHPAVQQLN